MFGYVYLPPLKAPKLPPSVRTRVLRALEAGPATQLDLQKALYPNGWTLAESQGVLDALRWLRQAPAEIVELVDEDLGSLKTVKYGLKTVSAAPSRSRP
jgi:hypothetical protein